MSCLARSLSAVSKRAGYYFLYWLSLTFQINSVGIRGSICHLLDAIDIYVSWNDLDQLRYCPL